MKQTKTGSTDIKVMNTLMNTIRQKIGQFPERIDGPRELENV